MSTVRSHGVVSTSQAGELLGCTAAHVRLLIQQGKLSGERIGRDWLVSTESVEALKQSSYKRASAATVTIKEAQVETLFTEEELRAIVNVASVPQRSPFRYPGGKTWLIPYARLWLASLRPKPRRLIECFAGGGGIGLMAGFEGWAEEVVLVELDPDVAVVWRVLFEGGGPELGQRILAFPFCREAVEDVVASAPDDPLEQAFRTILRNRVSRGGILAPGAGLVKTGEAGRGLASRWYPETLAARMQSIHEKRERFTILEEDALAVMAREAHREDTAFFIDPPYPGAGKRLYRYHGIDHERLFDLAASLRGGFLFTYDEHPVPVQLASQHRLCLGKIPMKSTHHQKKFEVVVSRDLGWLPF